MNYQAPAERHCNKKMKNDETGIRMSAFVCRNDLDAVIGHYIFLFQHLLHTVTSPIIIIGRNPKGGYPHDPAPTDRKLHSLQ